MLQSPNENLANLLNIRLLQGRWVVVEHPIRFFKLEESISVDLRGAFLAEDWREPDAKKKDDYVHVQVDLEKVSLVIEHKHALLLLSLRFKSIFCDLSQEILENFLLLSQCFDHESKAVVHKVLHGLKDGLVGALKFNQIVKNLLKWLVLRQIVWFTIIMLMFRLVELWFLY